MTRMLAIFAAVSFTASATAQTVSSAEVPLESVDDEILVIGSREKQAIKHQRAAEYVRSVSQTRYLVSMRAGTNQFALASPGWTPRPLR